MYTLPSTKHSPATKCRAVRKDDIWHLRNGYTGHVYVVLESLPRTPSNLFTS